MKRQRLFISVAFVALVFVLALIALRAYYVAISLGAGFLALRYRELWSLATHGHLPPLDERVQETMFKSVRNGFIYLVLALAGLMVVFSIRPFPSLDVVQLLGALLISSGAVYFLSYVFLDQVQPKLDERSRKMLRIFLVVAGTAVALFVVGVVLHNAISALLGVEEPVFFIIAVLIAPLAFMIGIVGSLVVFLKGLLARA